MTESQTGPSPGGIAGAAALVARNLRRSGLYIAFACIVLLFWVLTDGQLLQAQNLSDIVVQNGYVLILAVGMILVVIAGHIDLSVGSVVAATGAVAAVLMVGQNVSWLIAVPATVLFGALIGAWQGYWVAYLGLPAFIVTLAGMLVLRAVSLTTLGNQGIGPFPDTVRSLANGFIPGYLNKVPLGPAGAADLFTLIVGVLLVAAIVGTQWRARIGRVKDEQSVEPLPVFLVTMAAAAVAGLFVIVQLARFKNLPWVLVLLVMLGAGYSVVTGRAVFGHRIDAVGGDRQAATLSGVKVKAVTFWIFVNMGALAAVAGIIFAGRLNQAGPTAGTNVELDAITAAFIGGAGVQGGVGRVVGALTGGLIMAVITNGMSLIEARSEQVMLVKGLVLLAAVTIEVWTRRPAGASAA